MHRCALSNRPVQIAQTSQRRIIRVGKISGIPDAYLPLSLFLFNTRELKFARNVEEYTESIQERSFDFL